MSTDPIRLERRARQRFEVNLPVSIHMDGITVTGFTQDVSARGVFLYSETAIAEGSRVELTVTMPYEVTLTESMRVRCCGRVLRCA
ncbi:MAG TPA: PilZ domain-containing protein, partial [Terriglobales bacterium]|nr:PilZ domain-containing protein [Terriglobales bacterium]